MSAGRRPKVDELRTEAAACRRCDLWKLGTQIVFGEGAVRDLMLVGEQPGDVEDRQGRPFVGPAGRLLRELLDEVGISDERVYLTNAVKHFKWHPGGSGGKRRIHDKPNWTEIKACSHWLTLELAAVQPRLVVCLGATATQLLISRSARIGELRGQRLELEGGTPALVTIHPSAVLRARDERDARRSELRDDLELARTQLDTLVAARR
jgi:uracil-DNA glycosylase family protein